MNDRLNIVSVCRTFPTPLDPSGGVFVLNRVAAMANLTDVCALQPVPYFPGLRPLPRWAREHQRTLKGLRIDHAPMFYLPGALKSLDAGWLVRAIESRIAHLHSERRIDAIDAHFGYPEGAACVEVGRRLGISVFITVRGFETEYVDNPAVGKRMIDGLRSATGIVAVSHSMADLMETIGVQPDRVCVIHNAIDANVFSFGEKHSSRALLGLELHRPLIVSVGHLVSRKRHHVLIDAFAALSKHCPDAQLAIIGAESFEAAYPAMLRQRAESLGIANRLRFAGNIPPAQVADWLRAADVFALGTAREGCCNAVLEALAVGTPVVTTPVGDNDRFVIPGRSGALVPVDDATELASAISLALQSDHWERRKISTELHARVGTWDQVASRALGFFGHLLGSDAADSGSALNRVSGPMTSQQ